MYVGMLWFDNDSKTELNTKVARAAEYYRRKYGKNPNMCYVNPSMLVRNGGSVNAGPVKGKQKDGSAVNANALEAAIQTGSVEVRGLSTVLPNHFWIGISKQEAQTQ